MQRGCAQPASRGQSSCRKRSGGSEREAEEKWSASGTVLLSMWGSQAGHSELRDPGVPSATRLGFPDLGHKGTGPSWGSTALGGSRVPTAWLAAFLQGVESVKKELDESVLGQTGPYRRPERLRKRKEFSGEKFKEEKVFEPNE